MQSRRDEVYFYENYGVISWIVSCVRKRTVFYNAQSNVLRLFLRISGVRLPGNIRAISYGDLIKSTGIRSAAYERSLRKINEINPMSWGLNFQELIQIDERLITHKFLLEFLFKKYEFYGLATQYIQENPQYSYTMVVDPLLLDEDMFQGADRKVVRLTRFYKLEFILSLIVMPLFCFAFYLYYKKNDAGCFENSIICDVNDRKVYYMYQDLFGDYPNLRFVTHKVYLKYLEKDEIRDFGLVVHGLDSQDYRKLKAITKLFLSRGVAGYSKFSSCGSLLFDLYTKIALGILLTVNARDSAYIIAVEHMSTTKAVRNELLRLNNNKSIYLPYKVDVPNHFFSQDYQKNYDILCSPCELAERVYSLQEAKTKIFLRTGPYITHKGFQHVDVSEARIQRLLKFKGASTAITILSSGIFDETISGERRLMQLASRLAREPGVKIFIRPKPCELPKKYKNFFSDVCGGSDSILLTDAEYQLTDFMHVTDLFITFWSHSAADMCSLGGKIFCINFMDDNDMPLWQTVVDGVYLDERPAFDSIMAWVRDFPAGQRDAHDKRMAELSGLISYKLEDFASYKNNLLTQLAPYLPKFRA